ncbi:MAG TPA: metallophosphoesterase [Propionicimonas sp.]|uniref:metallophosphoesterase n=1 Tax=Propionicimonas sp. TaxID=1955623 RepID=UPI002F4098EC
MRPAEYPRPALLLAHLSDTHLRHPDDPLVRGVLDPRPHLVRALAAVEAHAPQALVFTGDLSDDGTAESYEELRRLVLPVAQRLGATVVWGNGNHDARAAFRSVLLDPLPAGHAAEPWPEAGPLNQAHDVDGLRVLWLDTTVPGSDHGEVAPESLEWLAARLSEPSRRGTILGMHHAPLPVVQDLAASWELHGQAGLAAVLEGSGVRAILAGHYHQSGFGTFAGIPVHVATSLCYTQDLASGRGMRGHDGAQGWHLVGVHAGTVTSTVAPLGHYPTIVRPRSPEESTAELAARGIAIAEA